MLFKQIIYCLVTLCLFVHGAGSLSAASAQRDGAASVQQALDLVKSGQLERAAEVLRATLQRYPASAGAANLLGVVRAQQQKFSEAEELFLRATKSDPQFAGAYANLGMLYLRLDKKQEAAKALEQAVKLEPAREDARYNLALLHQAQGNYASSLAHLEAISSENALRDQKFLYLLIYDYTMLKRIEEMRKAVARLEELPSLDATLSAKLGALLASQDNLREAIALMERARAAGPSLFELEYNLGSAYLHSEDLSRAKERYKAALDLQPDSVPTLQQLAQIAGTQNQNEEALSYLIRARKLAPDSPDVLYAFGWTCIKMHLADDAIGALKRAFELQPASPPIIYTLAVAWVEKKEFATASEFLKKYTALRPNDPAGHAAFAYTLYEIKQFEEAKREIEQSIKLKPEQVKGYYLLGLIAMEEGDEKRAADLFSRVLARKPDHAEAHAELGALYLDRKRYPEAKRYLEKAIALSPNQLKAHHHLAQLYGRLNEKEAAEKESAVAEKLRREQKASERTQLLLASPD